MVAESDTVFTVPEDMTTLVYPNVPTPVGDSRLKRVLIRSYNAFPGGQNRMPMTVTVQGKRIELTLEYVYTYKYDNQGRLIAESQEWVNGSSTWHDTITYQYVPSNRYIIARLVENTSSLYRSIDTLWLNERGLARNRLGTYRNSQYDSEDFLTWGESLYENGEVGYKISNVVQAGNIRSTNQYFGASETGGNFTWRYPVYTRQANLPNPQPFYGRISRQLKAEEILSTKGMLLYRDGDKYRVRYVYHFDKAGRVRRALSYGTNLASWFSSYRGDIALIDYEYE
jgi:hypothetical protein